MSGTAAAGDGTVFTRAVTTWVEPVLWYDLAHLAAREANGQWDGTWMPPSSHVHPVEDRVTALRLLSEHPLGAHWAEQIRSGGQGRPDISWRLWTDGPRPMVDIAQRLSKALSENGVDSALSGSLSMFLQCPFRLSADLDFSLPARLDAGVLSLVCRCVEQVGGVVEHAKPSYVGGYFRLDRLTVTLDIEAGQAYGLPLPLGCWDRRRTVAGLTCLAAANLRDIKRKAGRVKDAADLSFMDASHRAARR